MFENEDTPGIRTVAKFGYIRVLLIGDNILIALNNGRYYGQTNTFPLDVAPANERDALLAREVATFIQTVIKV